MKFYLGGPINGCTDEEAKGWREDVKKVLEENGHTYLDPMVRDYRGVEDEKYEEIVVLDKRDIAQCDVLLMNCPKPSYGTAMEIFYGYTSTEAEVVVVLPEGAPISPWIRYHATDIYFGSVVEAAKKLCQRVAL